MSGKKVFFCRVNKRKGFSEPVLCGERRRNSPPKFVGGPLWSETSLRSEATGEMAERLKAYAWRAYVGVTSPRVRIPVSPPLLHIFLPLSSETPQTPLKGATAPIAFARLICQQIKPPAHYYPLGSFPKSPNVKKRGAF